MNARIGLYALTLLNLALLALALARDTRPALAEGGQPVLRGGGLEIVDAQGRVRASISVMPAGKSPSGVETSETVLLRLITEKGRPSVKLGASEPTSGLSFAGPTGTKDTYVVLKSDGNVSSLKLRNEDGHERSLAP